MDSSLCKYLKERLRDTLEESKRHFDNYILVRDAYNDLLRSKVKLVKKSDRNEADVYLSGLKMAKELMDIQREDYKSRLAKVEN
jgi:hypothetical protein